MSLNNIVSYEIIAHETPNVIRNCKNCKKSTEFSCSDKFRVNANQKMIDIWLIYKCINCEGTWNCPILSRVHVNRIDPLRHQKYMENNKDMIWYHAFQISNLRKRCDAVNKDIAYEIRKGNSESISSEVTIRITCKYDFGLRIDKLIAEILGVSRSKVNALAKAGAFLFIPDVTLKDKVIDNLQISVKGNWKL
ncbi:DUF1062 domain-containing protein [Ornithinibacillus scapharcae]|uniref:DUF1062 domain-containing protein n=1 Tax=Ornithinibacillus scapharcae TaxID=1147159 RepID=UPI000225BDF8|nr:DUF1062 domain-containing protein [Ornithinibacillus scapharcae]